MSEILPMSSLNELATVTMGQSPEAASVTTGDAGLPFLQGCAEFGARFPEPRLHCSPPLRVAKSGSILISVRAPVGTTNSADQDYCIGRGLGSIFAKADKADNKFLLYAINENLAYLHQRSQGSTFLAIGSKELLSLPLPAPSLPVQQRIAGILSSVDEAIEQTEALIAKLEKVKAGMMHDLFTRGVTSDGRLRPSRPEAPDLYKQSPLGWIPADWQYDYLQNLTKKIVDGVHFTPEYIEHGIPFVTVKNLTAGRGIDFTNLNYIAERDHKIFVSRADPKSGDVLVTKDGTLGVSRIIEATYPEFSIFVSVAQLRPKTETLRTAMLYRFFDCGLYLRQLGTLSAGTGLKHIHLEHFKRFVIPLPCPREQDAIATIADSIDTEMTRLRAYRDKLMAMKEGLMADLLSGRVRVPEKVAA